MNVGSLFSGIGGLELGLEAHGHTVAWQAESDPFARAVLAKHWPAVRRYEDVRAIDAQAERVDIICGGFPCQDISNAGKREGITGAKSGLWSEFARIVGVLRPRYVFVENVAALVVRGLDRVLADLAALGFDAEWDCFRASDVGAPHRRERLFILANANGAGLERARSAQPAGRLGDSVSAGTGEAVANASEFSEREPANADDAESGTRRAWDEFGDGSGMGNADGELREEQRSAVAVGEEQRRAQCASHRFPPGPDRIGEWDGPQPAIRRSNDGIPDALDNRVDRLRTLGNAVVPQVAALAWGTLMERTAQIGLLGRVSA